MASHWNTHDNDSKEHRYQDREFSHRTPQGLDMDCGDKVRCISDEYEEEDVYEDDMLLVYDVDDEGDLCLDGHGSKFWDSCDFVLVRKKGSGGTSEPKPTAPPHWSTQSKGGSTMGLNSTIAGLYESTADAVLVNKYFSCDVAQGNAGEVLWSDKGEELLEKAKEQEAKDKARENVVRAQIVS